MPKSIKVDPASSPWYTEERSGLSICHYCGRHFEIGWDVSKQHFQGCAWLNASLKESKTGVTGGPQILVEDEQPEPEWETLVADE